MQCNAVSVPVRYLATASGNPAVSISTVQGAPGSSPGITNNQAVYIETN